MTHIDPKDLKPGQQIRVTFEVTASKSFSRAIRLSLIEDDMVTTTFGEKEFPALTCELLPELIKVGDRVQHYYGPIGTVLAMHNGALWISVPPGSEMPMTWALHEVDKIQDPAA